MPPKPITPSVYHAINGATKELEENGIAVTSTNQYLLICEWVDTWKKLAKEPEDFELLVALQKAETRLFNRIMKSH